MVARLSYPKWKRIRAVVMSRFLYTTGIRCVFCVTTERKKIMLNFLSKPAGGACPVLSL